MNDVVFSKRFKILLTLASTWILFLLYCSYNTRTGDSFSAVQLTAPYALLSNDVSLYSTQNEGHFVSTLYGPISHIMHLPIVFGSTPNQVVFIGNLLALIYSIFPIYLIYISVFSGKNPWSLHFFITSFLAICFIANELRYDLFVVHPDTVSYFFSGWCIYYALKIKQDKINNRYLLFIALFCSLSIYNKQTMIGLLAGIVIYLFIIGTPMRSVAKFMGYFTAISSTIFIALISLYGFDTIWLNMVDIPLSHPYQSPNRTISHESSFKVSVLISSATTIFKSYWLHYLILLIAIIKIPMDATSKKCLQLCLCIALSFFPIASLSISKIGGSFSHISLTSYYVFVAMLILLFSIKLEKIKRLHYLFLIIIMIMPLGYIKEIVSNSTRKSYFALRSQPKEESSFNYLKKHSGTIYFPWSTLSHQLVEGRILPNSDTLWSFSLAQKKVNSSLITKHFDDRLQYIAFPKEFCTGTEALMLHFPEFNKKITLKGLENYHVFSK